MGGPGLWPRKKVRQRGLTRGAGGTGRRVRRETRTGSGAGGRQQREQQQQREQHRAHSGRCPAQRALPPGHPSRDPQPRVTCHVVTPVLSRDQASAAPAAGPLWRRLYLAALLLIRLGWRLPSLLGVEGAVPRCTAEAKKAADVASSFCNLHLWQGLPGHSILCMLRSELGEGGAPFPMRCLLWSLPGVKNTTHSLKVFKDLIKDEREDIQLWDALTKCQKHTISLK